MILAQVRTDEEAIDVLSSAVATACSIGLHGRSRRRSFDATTRAGRRNRRRLDRVLGQCLEWYRADGCDADDGPLIGTHDGVRAAVSSYIVATLAGWLLSIVAGWLIELAVEAFVTWILSPESEQYRRGHQ